MSAAPRRLDPRTVVLRLVRQAPSTAFGLFALAAVNSRRSLLAIAAIALVVAVVTGLHAWLRWRRFTYQIADGELVIAAGLLTRTHRSIPLERVQDVSIEQKPLARVFGIAAVRVETGGSAADEALLDSVSLAEAERLRDVLRRRADAGDADEAGSVAPMSKAEPVLFAMPLPRVVLMGVFQFSMVWIGAVVGAVQFFGDAIGFDWDDAVRLSGVARAQVEERASVTSVLIVLVLAILIGAATGLVGTVLTEFGFRLTAADGRFRRIRGLLTRAEVVVAERRVQLALVERGWVSGRLGWASLRFQTLGGSDDPGGRQMMVPFGRDAEIAPVVDAAGLPRFDPLPLRSVAFGHVVRASVLQGGLPLLLIVALAFLAPAVLLLLPLLILPVGAALLARRYHRYAVGPRVLQVARGVLTRREWTVPRERVQAISIVEGPLQRLLGVVTVRIGTAGARGSARPDLVDVRAGDAEAVTRALLAD